METVFTALFDFHVNGPLYAEFPCCPRYAGFCFSAWCPYSTAPLALVFRVILLKLPECPLAFSVFCLLGTLFNPMN